MKVGQFVQAKPRSNYKFAHDISCHVIANLLPNYELVSTKAHMKHKAITDGLSDIHAE